MATTNSFRRTRRTMRQAGFTLMLAVMVSSIVLAIGVSIFDIVQKQIQLSSLSRDSQFAFYNADTAADCALYWDVKMQLFATSTTPTVGILSCDTQSPDITFPGPQTDGSGNWTSSVFTYQYAPNGQCARVTVTKSPSTVGSVTAVRTSIRADGFNTTCDGIAQSARALQRSVELNY